MNINTNALLTTLLAKVDPMIKEKIGNSSLNGKIDISSISKDKGIQTLLLELFKNISTGAKTKPEVAGLLDNSKNSLKFKNISTDLKQILNLIKTDMKQTPSLEKFTSILKTSLVDIKNIDEKVLKSNFQNSGVFLESKIAQNKESVSSNLKNVLVQLKDKMQILETIPKEITKDSKTTNIPQKANIESDVKFLKNIAPNVEIKSEVKVEIQNILKKIEIASQPNTKSDIQQNSLKSALSEIKVLEQKLTTNDMKKEIIVNLREAVQQVKNNILNNAFLDIKKNISLVKEQLENIKSNNTLDIKQEVTKIETKLDSLNNEKNVDKKVIVVKELVQQTTKVIDKISNSNIQELLKNNLSNIKNISSDVKTVMLQIKEIIEQPNNNENISKDLKNNVDKILSQIDYYQLSSYSSNTNHSYLTFLQDDLEDMDIKFNNLNDNEFSCLIRLALKEKGDLKILLQLDEKKNLSINMGVEQKEFKEMIQASLQKLRAQINTLGLSVYNLNIFDLNDELEKSNELKAYEDNQNLDFGVDIKV